MGKAAKAIFLLMSRSLTIFYAAVILFSGPAFADGADSFVYYDCNRIAHTLTVKSIVSYDKKAEREKNLISLETFVASGGKTCCVFSPGICIATHALVSYANEEDDSLDVSTKGKTINRLSFDTLYSGVPLLDEGLNVIFSDFISKSQNGNLIIQECEGSSPPYCRTKR